MPCAAHESLVHTMVVVLCFVFTTQFALAQMQENAPVFEQGGFTGLWSSEDEDVEEEDRSVDQDMHGEGGPASSAGNGGVARLVPAQAQTGPGIDNTMNANQKDHRVACLSHGPIANMVYQRGAPVFAMWRSEDGGESIVLPGRIIESLCTADGSLSM